MKNFLLLFPEIVLLLTMFCVIMSEITHFGKKIRFIQSISLVGLVAAFFQTMACYRYSASHILGGALSIDGFALFFKLTFIVAAGFAISSAFHTREIKEVRRSEYCILILASTLAMFLLVSASDLILIFLTLLFLNVTCYFLAAYGHQSLRSTEAAVKYLIFGSISLAFLLYSFSILFAFSHSLNMYSIHQSLLQNPLDSQVMLVVFGLAFFAMSVQIGAFPAYFFVPDVLEGAPTPISAFLSFGPRAAGFACMIRFLIVVFAQSGSELGQWKILGDFQWTKMISIVSALTMLIGALLAYRQKAAKRLLSDLVVMETGFLLMGLLVLDEVGITAFLYNLVIELFAVMGSYFVLAFFFDEVHSDQFQDLKGMMKRAVPESIVLLIFLLNLVGHPPMAGFIGKFTLIGVVIRHNYLGLGLVGVLSMVISLAAVARLAYVLIGDFKEVAGPPLSISMFRKIFLAMLLLPTILVGVFADFVFQWAGRSLGFIFW